MKKKRVPGNSLRGPLDELRKLKIRLRSYVNSTKLQWTGNPWEEGSRYSFILDRRLVDFVIQVIHATQQKKAQQDDADTIKQIRGLNKAIENSGEGVSEEEVNQKVAELLPTPETTLTDGNVADSNGYGSPEDQEGITPPEKDQEGSKGGSSDGIVSDSDGSP